MLVDFSRPIIHTVIKVLFYIYYLVLDQRTHVMTVAKYAARERLYGVHRLFCFMLLAVHADKLKAGGGMFYVGRNVREERS